MGRFDDWLDNKDIEDYYFHLDSEPIQIFVEVQKKDEATSNSIIVSDCICTG